MLVTMLLLLRNISNSRSLCIERAFQVIMVPGNLRLKIMSMKIGQPPLLFRFCRRCWWDVNFRNIFRKTAFLKKSFIKEVGFFNGIFLTKIIKRLRVLVRGDTMGTISIRAGIELWRFIPPDCPSEWLQYDFHLES